VVGEIEGAARSVPVESERRVGERRRGDRRDSRPEIQIFGAQADSREENG
jgi:hypothetical protein